MKLWRIDEDVIDADHEYGPDWHRTKLGIMEHRGVLVPVEPCEHGKYDAHEYFSAQHKGSSGLAPLMLCAGAGLDKERTRIDE